MLFIDSYPSTYSRVSRVTIEHRSGAITQTEIRCSPQRSGRSQSRGQRCSTTSAAPGGRLDVGVGGRSRRRAGRPAACRGYCRPASRLPAGRPSAAGRRGHAACGRTSTAPSRRPGSRSCCSRWACSRSRAGWCRPPAGPRPGRWRGRGRTGGDASAAPPPPASCAAESANRHCIASVDNIVRATIYSAERIEDWFIWKYALCSYMSVFIFTNADLSCTGNTYANVVCNIPDRKGCCSMTHRWASSGRNTSTAPTRRSQPAAEQPGKHSRYSPR